MSKRKSSLPAFLLVFLILSLLGLFGFNYVQNIATPQNLSKANIFKRKVARNDLTIDYTYNFPITNTLTITPHCDVEDLELQIDYYSKNNRLIETHIHPIGNVSKNQQYTTKINLTDFTDTELNELSQYTFTVRRGVTPLFG